jgi:hypothetical protein
LERAGYPARARKKFAVDRKIYGNSGHQGLEIVASGRERAGSLIASIVNVTALVKSISTIQIIELLQLVIAPRRKARAGRPAVAQAECAQVRAHRRCRPDPPWYFEFAAGVRRLPVNGTYLYASRMRMIALCPVVLAFLIVFD